MKPSQLSEQVESDNISLKSHSREKAHKPAKDIAPEKYRMRFRQFLQVVDKKSGSRIPKTVRVVKAYNEMERKEESPENTSSLLDFEEGRVKNVDKTFFDVYEKSLIKAPGLFLNSPQDSSTLYNMDQES